MKLNFGKGATQDHTGSKVNGRTEWQSISQEGAVVQKGTDFKIRGSGFNSCIFQTLVRQHFKKDIEKLESI